MTSPPGGGIVASPNRASSGPASRNDARIRAQSRGSGLDLETFAVCTRTSFGPVHAASAPRSAEQVEHRVHVPDARDVRQRDGLPRQQRRGEDRERAVLVSGDANRPAQRAAAFDRERVGNGRGNGHRAVM